MEHINGQPGLTAIDAFLVTKEALEISEFQVFRQAYRAWYGHPAAEQQLDPLFANYLKSNDLPFFVRHFCRNFIVQEPQHLYIQQARQYWSKRANAIAFACIVVMVVSAMLLG